MAYQILDTSLAYLKGVGPKKADLLQKELSFVNFRDLINHYPFRYVDKTKFHSISMISADGNNVQIKGILRSLNVLGEGRKKRMVGKFYDGTGFIELVWFKGVYWLEKELVVGKAYIIFGKVSQFGNKLNIAHPEMEPATQDGTQLDSKLAPVYKSTEKLNARGLDFKGRRKLIQNLFLKVKPSDFPETLPEFVLEKAKLISKAKAIYQIHLPANQKELADAQKRLKFEELFFIQISLIQSKKIRKRKLQGLIFGSIGDYFNNFFHNNLKFELTGAQKRVLKEIRHDLKIGTHMNRLLQGDVGSGKTVVGLMSMLMAIDNGFQACMVAPTEILAQQHLISIIEITEGLGLNIGFLSGSVKGKKRKVLLEKLASGEIHILIGTHALFEDPVIFKNLGLAITDEQHRFGVAQRAKLWGKNNPAPHILVMTATPIPRTLAMTLYGDLDVSVIDELPPGRKAIKTTHYFENHRLKVLGFMKDEIAKGRQIYVVYPLIEESEKLDLANLEEGFHSLSRYFQKPDYQISVVHGRMKAKDKDFEMQRFVEGKTQIMVATTVIEVGVNVPNASVMIIENTERFGLSQLHQLRGRVGRGADQSFCILMTSFKLSKEAKERVNTMVSTNNGFEIAEADLRLRGAGNIQGTQQSGQMNFTIADLVKDGKLLETAREIAIEILDEDALLQLPKNSTLKFALDSKYKSKKAWSLIS